MDLEPQDPRQRKKSIKVFASKVFKESTLSVISSIISADSVPRKIFRVLVFLVFTVGFLFQAIKFLHYVLGYPTVVNIEIVKPEKYLTPAFTFCNFNKIKRSKFCNKFPNKCFVPEPKFCEEYPFYCSGNTTLMPKPEYFSKIDSNQFPVDVGHKVKDLFHSKWDLRENVTGPYLRLRTRGESDIYPCYSLHARFDSPVDPLYTKSGDLNASWFGAKFDLTFNPEENELFSPISKAGILFLIHSPFTAENPFRKGTFMRAGYLYKITLRMEEEILLPYPYKTDCMNYTDIWLRNNRTGPRSQEMCKERCLLKASLPLFNCTPSFVLYPSAEKPCDSNSNSATLSNIRDGDLAAASEDLSSCNKNCKDDCYTISYNKEIQETYIVPKWKMNKKNSKPRLIRVRIYFDDSEIMSLRYKAQYQEVEVFSYIGGFVGIWLGVSLVQVADVFESIFRIIRYVFKKSSFLCKWAT